MSFTLIEVLGLAVFFIYLVIIFGFTQKIYSTNRIWIILMFSLVIPILIFFSGLNKDRDLRFISFGFLIFYYSIILFVIKITYSRVNTYLINRELISNSFSKKEFTYVFIIGETYRRPIHWDARFAKAPSWLDHLFSGILLFGPLLIVVLFL